MVLNSNYSILRGESWLLDWLSTNEIETGNISPEDNTRKLNVYDDD